MDSQQTQSKSAGGILINSRTNFIALIKMDNEIWGFPKGRVKEGESSLDAAKREILEETGIQNLEYIKELPVYRRLNISNPKEMKTIHMFLFKTTEEIFNFTAKEISDAKWVEKDKVTELLGITKDKEYFEEIKGDIRVIGY